MTGYLGVFMSVKVQSMQDIRRRRAAQQQMAASRSVASFVLGIASVALCVVPIMLVAAVAGLMLEKESQRLGVHPLQKPAKILCIIGIVLCSIVILGLLIALLAAGILSRGV